MKELFEQENPYAKEMIPYDNVTNAGLMVAFELWRLRKELAEVVAQLRNINKKSGK